MSEWGKALKEREKESVCIVLLCMLSGQQKTIKPKIGGMMSSMTHVCVCPGGLGFGVTPLYDAECRCSLLNR